MQWSRVAGLIVVGGSAALAGCAAQTGCGTAIVLTPYVQMLYPEPNATAVPDSTSVLVYNAGPAVPIVLSAGSASPSNTEPTGVPSPLPSPAASPLNKPMEYAVSLPALRAATTYTVTATVREIGCGIDQPETVRLGSFTTK